MSPRRRSSKIKYPKGIDPAALPQAEGKTIAYDPRGRGRWAVRYYDGGVRKEAKLGNGTLTMAQIHKAFYDWLEGSNVDTLQGLSNSFQESVDFTELAPRTQSDYKDCSKQICDLKTQSGARFGSAKLTRIRTATIREYRDARAKKAPTRAAHEIRYLKRLFNWAMEHEYMTMNPAAPIKLKGLTKPRDHYVEDTDYKGLINLAPLTIALAAHIGLLTGRRRTDILNLKLSDLTKEGIQFEENKTGKYTLVIWSKELKATIELAKKESKNKNSLFLFPGIHGSRYSDNAFKSAWTRVSQEMVKQGLNRFQFKDLRAKHATDLEEMGGDATENLVHGNRGTTTRHYIRRKKVVPLR